MIKVKGSGGGVNVRGATATPDVVFYGYTFFAGETTQMQTGTALGPGTPLFDMPWGQISEISTAGLAQTYFQLGDKKIIEVDGVHYVVEIVGFNHDDLADGSGKAGITFGMADCLDGFTNMNAPDHTNAGGWEACQKRATLQSTTIGQLPADLQAAIKPVIKRTSAGEQSTTIVSTTDTLFLFAEKEVLGTVTYSTEGEGSQYARFATGAYRVKRVDGNAADWWLRSPAFAGIGRFCNITPTGEADTTGSAYKCGTSFGFCV